MSATETGYKQQNCFLLRHHPLQNGYVKYTRLRQKPNITNAMDMSNDLTRKVFEFSHEGILITDSGHTILSVNKAFSEITGYCAEELKGKKPYFLYPCGEDVAAFSRLEDSILAKGYWQGEIWGQRKNGEIFPQWLTISSVTDATGNITHFISLLSDITELKRETIRLEYLAHHDALTGLPNHVLFNERLTAAISLAYRCGTVLGVLSIAVDGLKEIIDRLGQKQGDQLLQQIAGRLKQCIRESDAVARRGRDEFVILLHEISDQVSAEEVAGKILRVLHMPFHLSTQSHVISTSIGIALFPDHGSDTTTLLERADAAMYEAKLGPTYKFRISFPPQHRKQHHLISELLNKN